MKPGEQVVSALRGVLRPLRPMLDPIRPKYWPWQERYRVVVAHPAVLFVVGMPRTGSTLAKRYLGDHPDIELAPAGRPAQAWVLANKLSQDRIVLDKNTRNLARVREIYMDYGDYVGFLCIVRDPRDELVSLLETDRHPEIPRDRSFWPFWEQRYSSFLRFAARYGRRGAKVALIRYEDLTMFPVKVKKCFLRWLGLDAKVARITPEYHDTVQKIAEGIDISEDWKTHQTNRVHTDSIGRWREFEFEKSNQAMLLAYREFPRVIRLMEALGYGAGVMSPTLSIRGFQLLG